jgi:predicted DNA-binding transcriptional regulator AlpA
MSERKNRTKTQRPRGLPPPSPTKKHLHLDKRAGQIAAAEPILSDDAANTDDDLLRTSEVASWLGVTKQWLEGSRREGYGPPFIKLAPLAVRYRRGDVRAWLKERQFIWTSSYPESSVRGQP